MKYLIKICLLPLLFILVGCGVKGPLYPPPQEEPAQETTAQLSSHLHINLHTVSNNHSLIG